MSVKIRTMGICVVDCAILCLGQTLSSTPVVLAALGIFLVALAWECYQGNTLPILLFFLPWSSLMKLSVDSYSIYTVGLVMVCGIVMVKKRLDLRGRDVLIGLLLVVVTLISKLLDGSSIDLSYVAFMMLIVMLYSLKREDEQGGSSFTVATIFFSIGILLAAFAAQLLAGYSNFRQYMVIDYEGSITRWSGLYQDPNFYSAQIVAALGGVFLLLLRCGGKRMIPAMTLAVLLIYCGLLSASKSFALVLVLELALWLFLLFRLRRGVAFKLLLILLVAVVGMVTLGMVVFQNLLQSVIARFSNSDSFSSLTTGRSEIWEGYLQTLLNSPKMLLIGNGITNVYINQKASHNTILQVIFQFGLIGTALLIWWGTGLEHGTLLRQARREKKGWEMLLLAMGLFLPWMALDMLFFDEFFLFTWYFLLGVQELVESETTAVQLPAEEEPAGDPPCDE